MGLFNQILSGDTEADLYDDPEMYGTRRSRFQVPDEVKRNVIQDVQPELEGKSVTGFIKNAAEDVSTMASGFGAILGQVLVHPIKSAEAVGSAALHPLDTAHMFVDPLAEKYTPGKDESIPSMLLRNAYDHPFDTLMDASFIVGGPSSVAGKIAKATGFERTARLMEQVAERASKIDPITAAVKGGGYVLKTKFPDAFARLRTSSSLADAAAGETVRQDWLVNDFNKRALEAQAHLNPAEMAVRFPYLEGRLSLNPDNTITELTHTGAREMSKIEAGTAIRPEALDLFAQKYSALQREYEVAAKISPEQVAAQAALNHQHKIEGWLAKNPAAEISKSPEQVYQEAFQEATERSQKRAAKSTMTALDAAKDADFKGRIAKAVVEQHTFDLQEIEGMLPRAKETTLQEALDVMGPKGGIIVPHSMESMAHEQSTIGNMLGKIGEASVYEENTGTLFRNGMLQNHDPVAALSRYYRAAVRGDTFATITEKAAQEGIKHGYAQAMPHDWNPALDADVRAGTHQPLHIPSMHLDGNLQEHFDRLQSRLIEVADDANIGVKDVNMMDVATNMTRNAHETFPIRKDAGGYYKISSKMGDELKFYKQSFEPATNPFAQVSDKYMMQPYNLMNLSAKAGRIANNGFGNTEMITMQGLHPFSVRGWDAFLTMGRATLGKAGILKDEVSQKLAGVFDLPGVPGGLGRTQPFQETRGLGAKLAASKNPLVSTFGKYTEMMARTNENLEHIYRAASTIYELKPGGLESVRNLIHSSASMATFADRIDELTKMGVHALGESDLKGALKGMNRYLNDYDRTTAFERRIGRHVFPYHKFYKHSAELLVRFPFESPVKAQMARRIGGAALQDAKDELKSYGYDWNTMVPEFMRDSIPMKVTNSPDGSPAVLMFNTKGVNPFSFLAGNDVGEQGIGALHPLAKIAIEQATGVNLFTREKFQGPLSTFSGRKVDPETGAIVEDYNRPNIVEHYLRQFWPYQTLRDVVAHGRVATDTADLLDLMGSGAPGAYQMDDRGLQRRKPRPLGSLTPLARMFGTVPQTLQMPTKQQVSGRAAIASSQLADLMQQHPEARDRIMASIRANLNSWRPNASPVAPRRF